MDVDGFGCAWWNCTFAPAAPIPGFPSEQLTPPEIAEVNKMAFCEPGIDNIITLPPTFGMYKVSAHVHGIKVKEVPLDSSFQIDAQLVLEKSKVASQFLASYNKSI